MTTSNVQKRNRNKKSFLSRFPLSKVAKDLEFSLLFFTFHFLRFRFDNQAEA